jgi:hypothetical protein
MNEKATKQIVSEIFGENGLIEADTTVDFTKLVTNIESKYEASVGAYLTDKIIPTIREYVYSTCMQICTQNPFLCLGWEVCHLLMLQMTILGFFLGQIIKTSAAKYPFLFVTCFAKLFFHIACGKCLFHSAL